MMAQQTVYPTVWVQQAKNEPATILAAVVSPSQTAPCWRARASAGTALWVTLRLWQDTGASGDPAGAIQSKERGRTWTRSSTGATRAFHRLHDLGADLRHALDRVRKRIVLGDCRALACGVRAGFSRASCAAAPLGITFAQPNSCCDGIRWCCLAAALATAAQRIPGGWCHVFQRFSTSTSQSTQPSERLWAKLHQQHHHL